MYIQCRKTHTITSDRLIPVYKVYLAYLFIVSSTFFFRMQSNVDSKFISVFLNTRTSICGSFPAYPSLPLHNPHLRSIIRFSYWTLHDRANDTKRGSLVIDWRIYQSYTNADGAVLLERRRNLGEATASQKILDFKIERCLQMSEC